MATSPEGSEHIARWAASRGMFFQRHPDLAWFQAWEPFDTMVSGTVYYNAASFTVGTSQITLAEPWVGLEDSEPLARTVLAFCVDPRFTLRVAARGGEHFNTRVSFLENAKMPTVALGDPDWDEHMTTLAASPSEAQRALPLGARQHLAHLGFAGHLEVRPGGLVLHFAGTLPTVDHYERLSRVTPEVVRAFR
ncbi:MAG: hypothetical protein KIT72_02850 [Polyangiaceae bacterium]|nr:hypothetical protein [Polyangiaceae bacterium]MCW5789338.1 hypothetical protein [Polyangiaceae bacterium]